MRTWAKSCPTPAGGLLLASPSDVTRFTRVTASQRDRSENQDGNEQEADRERGRKQLEVSTDRPAGLFAAAEDEPGHPPSKEAWIDPRTASGGRGSREIPKAFDSDRRTQHTHGHFLRCF